MAALPRVLGPKIVLSEGTLQCRPVLLSQEVQQDINIEPRPYGYNFINHMKVAYQCNGDDKSLHIVYFPYDNIKQEHGKEVSKIDPSRHVIESISDVTDDDTALFYAGVVNKWLDKAFIDWIGP